MNGNPMVGIRPGWRERSAVAVAAAVAALVLAGSGCSIHLDYEKGDLRSENVLKEWETDKTAELRIGLGGTEGSGIAIEVSGFRKIHQEFERKYVKLDVCESYNPLWEFLEIPLSFLVPVISGAVIVPLWVATSVLYGLILQGCVDGKLFEPLEKFLDADLEEIGAEKWRFGDFVLGLLFDFTGFGIPFLLLPCSFGAAAEIADGIPVVDGIVWFPVLLFGEEGAGKAIDPTRNYFSSITKTDTGESFSEKDERVRDETGPLKECEVEVAVNGQTLQGRTDDQGKILFEGRSRKDAGFHGMRRSAPLVLQASAKGFETREGGKRNASPEEVLPVLSVLEGSDWTSGERAAASDLDVEVKAENPDGQRAIVRISVRNKGSTTLYRTHAQVHSRTRALDDWITTFGVLKPGETVVRVVEMPVSPGDARLPHSLLVEMRGPLGRLSGFVEAELPAR
jgi:hypothetical protein